MTTPAAELFTGNPVEWDTAVMAFDGSTACHLSGWREVIGDVLGHECLHSVTRAATGEITGLLPLVHVRSRIFGDHLVSMPFLNDGGPLGDVDTKEVLVRHAVELARARGVKLLELRTREATSSALETNARKVTVLLPLAATSEEMWSKGLPSKLRSQIRRPMKEGMETRFGLDQREPFYEVFARNMRDLGTPVLGAAFFERLAKVFPANVLFGAVYQGETAVAAGCGFVWGDEFEITWASSLREFNRYSPNMLLYWSFMEQVIGRGVRTFNFGRCTPGGGTHRFKLQWGGSDLPLEWQQWSSAGVAATPNPDANGAFRIATQVWSRLPLQVANRIGPLLAPSLP